MGQPGNLPRQDFWVADGPVLTTAETNGVLYIGGEFQGIAPNGGRGGLFNIFSGDAEPLLPQVNGAILSVIPDGSGGWFVGGLFRQIGSVPRTNLARILPDLTVDTNWNPNPYGFATNTQRDGVYCLLRGSNALYVGGIFTNIAGTTRSNLAALDPITGAALSWSADVTGEVYCLANWSNSVYFGGRFAAVKGVTRSNIAAVHPVTGALQSWNPNAAGGDDPNVNALVATEDGLYVGGYFSQIGSAMRNGLAVLNHVTGLAGAWNPNVSNANNSYGVQAIALNCNTVYFGGYFTNVGGLTRSNLAAVDTVTGAPTGWNPGADREILAMTLSGNTVYAGGRFTTIGGAARNSVAALDASSGQPTVWSPRSDSSVIALALVGDKIFIGGGLSAGGLPRRNLAAFDVATGQPLSWAPETDGAVWTLAVSASTVYAGGTFKKVSGFDRVSLAAINRTNGQVLSWRADATDPLGFFIPSAVGVYALGMGSNALYVGGAFTSLGGFTRANAGAVNLTNAAITSWAPGVYGVVRALALSTNSVYLGGSFDEIQYPLFITSYYRTNIAEVSLTNGAPTTWSPSANDTVLALTLSGSSVYAGGFFTSIGGAARNFAAALSRTTGAASAWDPLLQGGLNPAVLSFVVASNRVYLGGGFATAGGQPRAGLAAVDIATGALYAFDPQLGDLRALVFSMALRNSTLFCGGLFLTLGDEVRPALAAFVPDGFPRLDAQPGPQNLVPGQNIQFQVSASGQSPLTYQWQFNGTNLVSATNVSLTISNAQVTNSGLYRITVSNTLGRVRSLDAPVTILLNAAITAQPTNVTTSPGSNVVLSVTASGSPPPSYQWRLNGVNIPGAVGSSLTISNAQQTNGGRFDVIVANHSTAVRSATARVLVSGPNIAFADTLTNAPSLFAGVGLGAGSNTFATKEPNEPNHVDKIGGKSVWMRWTATNNGIATFSTRGSSFDTLLAVYTGTTVSNLVPVAADEDRGGFLTSKVSFNAQNGSNYWIAIDGLGGRSGDIVCQWRFDPTNVAFPRILAQPISQAVTPGQNATFTVSVFSPTPVGYQWYHACRLLPGATNSSLIVSNVQQRDVGEYSVVITNSSPQPAQSFGAYLEISPEADLLSFDKLDDLLVSESTNAAFAILAGLRGGRSASLLGFPSVSAGTLGSQIINNFNSTTEDGEPIHSDVPGGSSRWYKLTAAGDGTFIVDTIGSDIDTLLAVYRGTSLASLELVGSDDNSAPDRSRSLVSFPATNGFSYLIAADGVRGAIGNIQLNWRLGTAPGFSGNYHSPVLREGDFLLLNSGVTNAAPTPTYQWRRNGLDLAGATNLTYALTNIQFDQWGTYSVVVSNFMGVITNTIATLVLDIPLRLQPEMVSGVKQFRVIGTATQAVTLRLSQDLSGWSPLTTNADPLVPVSYLDTNSAARPKGFYQLSPWP